MAAWAAQCSFAGGCLGGRASWCAGATIVWCADCTTLRSVHFRATYDLRLLHVQVSKYTAPMHHWACCPLKAASFFDTACVHLWWSQQASRHSSQVLRVSWHVTCSWPACMCFDLTVTCMTMGRAHDECGRVSVLLPGAYGVCVSVSDHDYDGGR